MGYAGDLLGRNSAMIITLGLVAISAVASALAPTGGPTQVYIGIIIARFFLGIGVGGVYPLSATKAAEDSGDSGHGNGEVNISAAAFAFFWQIPGSMVSLSSIMFHVSVDYIENIVLFCTARLLGFSPTFSHKLP